MKRLFLSAIFAIIALASNAQEVIAVKVTEYRLTVFTDTNSRQSEFIPYTATYFFDIDNNIITSFINGNVVTKSVFTCDITDEDSVRIVGFTYNDSPHFSWIINLTTQEITYREGYMTEDWLFEFVAKF